MALRLLVALLLAAKANAAEPIRVAVIDTGLNLNDPRFSEVLCKTGHKDFTGTGIRDTMGHGTHIAGLIKQYAVHTSYCLMILKYYDDTAFGFINGRRMVQSIEYAKAQGAKVINISADGPGFEEAEYLAIKSDPTVIFIVAAGNNRSDIGIPTQERYPASYGLPNIRVVGNLDWNGNIAPLSDWGKVVEYWEVGEAVESTAIDGGTKMMSGASQATAIATGKFLAGELRKKIPITKALQCIHDSSESPQMHQCTWP